MAENSAISWTDHTFNPWIGCTKVSPACDGCYAEALMGGEGRFARVTWGAPGKGEGTRSRTAPSTWKQPRKWNREAGAAIEAWRTNPFARPETPKPTTFVFCASLADVFDNAVPEQWRRDLFELIRETPNLTWLLLTKRPGNILGLSCAAMTLDQQFPRNAAIGCTVVNQAEADRDVPKLLAAKAALKPAFVFLSMEPLLGPVDLEDIPCGPLRRDDFVEFNALTGSGYFIENDDGDRGASPCEFPTLDWVITGGETDQGDHKARPADPAWFASLRDQCAGEGVAFHFKQWGEWQPAGDWYEDHPVSLLCRVYHEGAWTDDGAVDGEWMVKRGKHHDPCTLDGVRHDARPAVSA